MMMRRVPLFLQATQTECGLVCSSMIMSYYGTNVPIGALRRKHPVGRDGLSLLDMKTLMTDFGYRCRGMRMNNMAGLFGINCPFIMLWGRAHFIVVTNVTKKHVFFNDPAIGRRRLNIDEFYLNSGKILLEVTPTEKTPKIRRSKQGLKSSAASFITGVGGELTALFGALLAMSIINLLPAGLTAYIVDQMLPHDLKVGPASLIATIALMGFGFFSLNIQRSFLIIRAEKKVDVTGSKMFFNHLIHLPFSFFFGRPVGDLLLRFSSIASIRDALTSRLIPLAIDLLTFVIYFALIVMSSYIYGLTIFIIGGILVIVVASYAPVGKELADVEIQARSASQSMTIDSLTGIENAKAMGQEDSLEKTWSRVFFDEINAAIKREKYDGYFGAFIATIGFIAPIILLTIGVFQVRSGTLSLGQMLALNTISASALAPLSSMGVNAQILLTTGVHLFRIRDVLDEKIEDSSSDAVELNENIDSVEFRDVGFSFEGAKHPVLDHLNFRCEAGRTIAIVGATGSGKSTIGRLLCGLLHPSSGTVLINNKNIDEFDGKSFRRRIGVVSQGVTASQGTIDDNVRAGRDYLNDDDVTDALVAACLWDDIKRMPMGVYTPLGERGTGLSGGQLQRLVIARALVHSPDLILFDEATSNVDVRTEMKIMDAVKERCRILFVITHRVESIMRTDSVLFVKNGVILAEGSPRELLDVVPSFNNFIFGRS